MGKMAFCVNLGFCSAAVWLLLARAAQLVFLLELRHLFKGQIDLVY